jgi:hypothetical protein
MQPIPYEIREDDIDEVLSAYESVGGGTFTPEQRTEACRHVMRHVIELNEAVQTAPEERRLNARVDARDEQRAGPITMQPGEPPSARRDMALAAIEDLLIRDGFIDAADDETRVYPVMREPER